MIYVSNSSKQLNDTEWYIVQIISKAVALKNSAKSATKPYSQRKESWNIFIIKHAITKTFMNTRTLTKDERACPSCVSSNRNVQGIFF